MIWASLEGEADGDVVLFYFAQSPFHDPVSKNQELIDQCSGVPEREFEFLSTRQKMEKALLDRPGLQFVVDVDPLANPVLITNPSGQQEASDLWVIRKQELLRRGDPKTIRVLDYYYIYNTVIFQAPRVKSVLDYRMLQSMLSVDKVLKTACELPIFSASHGHTYFRPGQKATAVTATSTQASRIGTPAPETGTQLTQELDPVQETEPQSNEQTLREALKMTMDHGQTFYDDAPLVGEPGSFRFASVRNPVQSLKAGDVGGTGSVVPSKASTPMPSQNIKPGSVPTSPGAVEKIPETVVQAKPKPKRKKSMPAAEVGTIKNGTVSSPTTPIQRKA